MLNSGSLMLRKSLKERCRRLVRSKRRFVIPWPFSTGRRTRDQFNVKRRRN